MAQSLFLRVSKGDICPKFLKQGSRRMVRKKNSPNVYKFKAHEESDDAGSALSP